MNVLIADNHGIIRLGMSQIIKDVDPSGNVYEAATLDEAIGILDTRDMDLLIVDVNISGGADFRMINILKSTQPGISVLVFSTFREDLYAARYFKAGAAGYLQKDASTTEIKSAIKAVIAGSHYMSPRVQETFAGRLGDQVTGNWETNPLMLLSDRETEIARMLVSGISQTKIAQKLNLHTSTVGTHKNRVFDKLAVANLAELIEKYRIYDQP